MSYDANETSQFAGQPVEVYKFVRGGAVWRFADADEIIEVDGIQYQPALISRDQVDQSNEDWAGSITITVPRDNPVALLFVPYLPIEPVGVTVYRRHRGETEFVPIFIGKVASAAFSGSEAMLSCMPVGEALRRLVPGLCYQVPCNHALYGQGCGVNKEAFKVTGALSVVSGDTIKSTAFTTKPDGWFATGAVKRADGDWRFIVAHVGDTITLMSPFPGAVPGEIVTAYAGCDRTETTCKDKFNNLPNHAGFARIPTLNPYNTDIAGLAGNGGSVLVNPDSNSGGSMWLRGG